MSALSSKALLKFAAPAAPLAFAALPLYVYLPQYYSARHAAPLAAIGSLLLAARLLDAIADPLIGSMVDRVLSRGRAFFMRCVVAAACLMVHGFALLWWSPPWALTPLMLWLAAALTLTYLAYSFLTVAHQGLGTRLSADTAMLSRISTFREAATLCGVIAASALPALMGEQYLPLLLALLMAAALPGLRSMTIGHPWNSTQISILPPYTSLLRIINAANFRLLCIVYVINGIAAAVPATLLLFFVRDRLALDSAAAFLLAYFAAAAVSLPLWLRLVGRIGLERAWLMGMLLAILAFVGAGQLGAGDGTAFMLVCIGTGVAAGADLALPNAMLMRSIHAAGHSEALAGSYFGLWNMLTKLNLALAAGLALPLLQWLGYTPGARDAQALNALTLAYCWLPCTLKLLAAFSLWRFFIARPVLTVKEPLS